MTNLPNIPELLNPNSQPMKEWDLIREKAGPMGSYALEAYKAARTDVLTGLPNRRALIEDLTSLLGADNVGDISVSMFDLDKFKAINDDLGHPIGDEALKSVATGFKANLRAGDVLYRFGGDEFIIVSQEVNNSDESAHENADQEQMKPEETDRRYSAKKGKLRAGQFARSFEQATVDFKSCKGVPASGYEVTGTYAVTDYQKNDSVETIIKRVDDLLKNEKNYTRS